MTINELIERLQEAAEDGFGESEVRLATQPSWPLQFTVGGVVTPDDRACARGQEPDEEREESWLVVYITEGRHPDDSPYAPAGVFESVR